VPTPTGPAYAPPAPPYPPAPAYAIPVPSAPPAGYDPTLGMPVSGAYGVLPPVPPGAPPVQAGGSGGKVAIAILSSALALFVIASGVLGALFWQTSSESSKRAEEIASLQDEKADLQRELDFTARDLSDAEDDLDAVTEERDQIASCIEAFLDWLVTRPNTPEEDAAAAAAEAACDPVGYWATNG
jgi:hypothetical protein